MKYRLCLLFVLLVMILSACQTQDATVEVEDTKVVAQDDTTKAEVEVTDDTIKTEIKTEAIPEVENKVAIGEWCVAGQTYEFSNEGGSSSTTIQGVEMYKGSEFCKGISKTTAGPMEVVTTYYFTQGGEEMWVISDVAGAKTETHITN